MLNTILMQNAQSGLLRRLYNRFRRVNPVIVYQMGKVGSSTVQNSVQDALKRNNIHIPVYHIHNLNNLDKMISNLQANIKRPNSANTLLGLQQGKEILELVNNNVRQRWNLITLVREPVAQNVGAFFHNMHEFFPNWKEDFDQGILTIDVLRECFLTRYNHRVTKIWFEEQMEPVWGMDVYATPFPREQGYEIYHGPRADLLLLRLEDLDRIGAHALEKFLGIPGIEIVNSNVAEDKDYREIYRAFKQSPLPAEFIDKMYDSRFMTHFYSPAEIAAFRRRWSEQC